MTRFPNDRNLILAIALAIALVSLPVMVVGRVLGFHW
jgi:hypothetical protein